MEKSGETKESGDKENKKFSNPPTQNQGEFGDKENKNPQESKILGNFNKVEVFYDSYNKVTSK